MVLVCWERDCLEEGVDRACYFNSLFTKQEKAKAMKTFLVSICILVFSFGICFALSVHDDGYSWNVASYEERIAVCKTLAGKIGKDYIWWPQDLEKVVPEVIGGQPGMRSVGCSPALNRREECPISCNMYAILLRYRCCK